MATLPRYYPHVCLGCGQTYHSLIPISPAFDAHVSECVGRDLPINEWPEFDSDDYVVTRIAEIIYQRGNLK